MTSLEYQLDCLYRLRTQLKDMPQNQFRKYPEQTSWIKWEIEKLETVTGGFYGKSKKEG